MILFKLNGLYRVLDPLPSYGRDVIIGRPVYPKPFSVWPNEDDNIVLDKLTRRVEHIMGILAASNKGHSDNFMVIFPLIQALTIGSRIGPDCEVFVYLQSEGAYYPFLILGSFLPNFYLRRPIFTRRPSVLGLVCLIFKPALPGCFKGCTILKMGRQTLSSGNVFAFFILQ